jgi:hypothetical protein
MFSCDDISGINDIRLISNPIHTPSQELEEIEIKIPPINVVDKRIFVGVLGIREDSYTLWMGYELGNEPLGLVEDGSFRY